MSRFKRVFRNQHVVLPVIHAETADQAERNINIAMGAGADGAFVINHSISPLDLFNIVQACKNSFPAFWLGVNYLGTLPEQTLQLLVPSIDGLWIDNAEIDERRAADDQPAAAHFLRLRHTQWGGLYFGGVAFKYQRKVVDVAAAAKIAARYMDVITTSGPGTGHKADLDKMAAMRAATNAPIAIASGITPQNVADYLPFADAFLVATGVSSSFTELNPVLVTDLVQKVRRG